MSKYYRELEAGEQPCEDYGFECNSCGDLFFLNNDKDGDDFICLDCKDSQKAV